MIFIVTSCATNQKFGKEHCKDLYGYFTKAKDCLALKFENSNPKKYQEYKALHSVVLKTIANQVYENKINNDNANQIISIKDSPERAIAVINPVKPPPIMQIFCFSIFLFFIN